MRDHRFPVRATANFNRCLTDVEAFLMDSGNGAKFDRLVAELLEVVGHLETLPRLGRPFLSRRAGSVETLSRVEALRQRLGEAELREDVLEEYLLLYAVKSQEVYLLAVKHQKQLSFDLPGIW